MVSVPVYPAAPPAPEAPWTIDPSRIGPITPIRNLGNALGVLLMITAAALLLWALVPDIGWVPLILSLVSAIVTLVWLYRARLNVEGLAHQRRKKGWAIGGWFCPVVFLWFPFQIVQDIARTDKPVRPGNAGTPILSAWWACWLLAWFTGFHYTRTHTVYSDGRVFDSINFSFTFGGTVLARLFGAAAAILLAVIVREISARQEHRSRAWQ